jgi:hypothetical protein
MRGNPKEQSRIWNHKKRNFIVSALQPKALIYVPTSWRAWFPSTCLGALKPCTSTTLPGVNIRVRRRRHRRYKLRIHLGAHVRRRRASWCLDWACDAGIRACGRRHVGRRYLLILCIWAVKAVHISRLMQGFCSGHTGSRRIYGRILPHCWNCVR